MHLYTLVCGVALAAMALFIILLAALNVSDAKDTCEDGNYFTDGDDSGTCKLAVDQAVTFISMALFLLFFAGLTVAAEVPRASRCVARYFGFLCSRVGKGLYLLFCGAILATLGRYFDDTDASKDAGGADALAPFVVGMMFVGGGALQLSCACCMPSDPARGEFLRWVRAPSEEAATRAGPGQVDVVVDGDNEAPAPAEEGSPNPPAEEGSPNQAAGGEARRRRMGANSSRPNNRVDVREIKVTAKPSQDAKARAASLKKLRAAAIETQRNLSRLTAEVMELSKAGAATSRTGHLRTLEDRIGPPPARTWRDEWEAVVIEHYVYIYGSRGVFSGPEASSDARSPEAFAADFTDHIEDIMTTGNWPHEAAETYRILSIWRPQLARALREGDPCYAAITYRLCDTISAQRHAFRGERPPKMYRPLLQDAPGGIALSSDEPAWLTIEEPDRTGFRGLTSSSLHLVDCAPACFTEEGFRYDESEPVGTGPIVCFEAQPEDEHGAHTAIMTGAVYGCFPPNTLFRFKRVEAPGTWEAPGGVRPRVKLIVVSATFRPPRTRADGAGSGGGKLCGSTTTLTYGDRAAFVRGLDDILAKPILNMEGEFARDDAWRDWKGVEYTLRGEWAYANGPAKELVGCSPGTRDAGNSGMTVESFAARVNDHVRERRARGLGTNLLEADALLTLEEVVAIRLYSGPAYAPINAFLRQVAKLDGVFRREVATHVGLTFAATVRNIVCGIRKLAAVATPQEASAQLWRGVRGELPRAFWVADEQGLVCATDLAFMSTSRNRSTPLDYMERGGAANVLWQLEPKVESDAAFHCGADISMLSQFAAEEEVLFPPCTMLSVTESMDETSTGRARAQSLAKTSTTEGDKTFVCVRVLPSFI